MIGFIILHSSKQIYYAFVFFLQMSGVILATTAVDLRGGNQIQLQQCTPIIGSTGAILLSLTKEDNLAEIIHVVH